MTSDSVSERPQFLYWGCGVEPGTGLLLVDPDTVLVEVLAGLAEARGFRVLQASTGSDALVVARRERPAVIVMAPSLADLPSLMLLDVLRHDVVTREIPVIVMGEDDVEREAILRGAYDFVKKPVHPERLSAYLAARVPTMKANVRKERILVVDDEPACRELSKVVLESHGYRVDLASGPAEAMASLDQGLPDLIVMDVMMPGGDGVATLDAIRANVRYRRIPAIFATALGGITDKLRALKAGGDDYLVKPFDARELAARVELTLRKVRERESVSPNTLLPGTYGIVRELHRRHGKDELFAFCYIDVDNFKSFNDNYGYVRADAIIRQLADILQTVTSRLGRGDELLGHIAGDDFVLVGDLDTSPRILEAVVREFDAIIPFHYDPVDRAKGYIVAEDRYGTLRRFPLMTLSAVALRCLPEPAYDYVRISDDAAALKKRAKKIPTSVVLKDW